jgi:hypothetical protein
MAPIPPDGQGVTLRQVERAKADHSAVVIAFGEFFQDRGRDSTFGLSPELGAHDIHMMQGNGGSFADENRIAAIARCSSASRAVKPVPCSSVSACSRPRPTSGETRASSRPLLSP